MNTIDELLRFASKFRGDVEGRARAELSEEEKTALVALAEERADEDQREMLIPLLSKNEAAMEFLAGLVR